MHSQRHAIPRLGLTGGIGAGKSTALAYLCELGAAVISSDDIVRGLYEQDEIVAAVRAHFGDDVVDEERVNRSALARVVFADQHQLEWLERLLHPHVRASIETWARAKESDRNPSALLVAEVPLLFEAGLADDFDFTMVITAPVDTRRRRLLAKFTVDDLDLRLSRQMPEEEKATRADFLYLNVGSRRELREALGEAVAQILSRHAGASIEASL
ncbi:MAG: dephospho-CoA kinase [Thermoleophilia bacterium]